MRVKNNFRSIDFDVKVQGERLSVFSNSFGFKEFAKNDITINRFTIDNMCMLERFHEILHIRTHYYGPLYSRFTIHLEDKHSTLGKLKSHTVAMVLN